MPKHICSNNRKILGQGVDSASGIAVSQRDHTAHLM